MELLRHDEQEQPYTYTCTIGSKFDDLEFYKQIEAHTKNIIVLTSTRYMLRKSIEKVTKIVQR